VPPIDPTSNPRIRIDGADATGIVIGDAADGVTLPGIRVNDNAGVIAVGPNARGLVAGDGWSASTGGIVVGAGSFVQAGGDGAVAVDVGDDARVSIEGRVVGGAPDAPSLAAVRTGDQSSPDAVVLVTGRVTAAGADALGISTGTRTLLVGESLFDDPLAPSIQVGTTTDPGRVDGDAEASALIDLRTGANPGDYGYLLVNPGSAVVANETLFYEPDRAVAVQGTDGAERVDNYGQIRGKVRLEGGDDLFLLGTTGVIGGSQFVDGGDGRDRLELSNRAGALTNRPEAVFSFSQFWNFETLVVDDRVPWRATGTSTRNAFEGVFITPGSSLTVESPIDFSSGADTFVNEGAFDGEAALGAGADVYQQFQPDGLTTQSRVDGGAGLDELDLQDSGTDTFGALDLETQVTGFERIILRTGGEWALAGAIGAPAPGSSLAVEGDAQLRVTRPLRLAGAVDFDADSTLLLQVNPATVAAYIETPGAITIAENAPGTPSATLVIEPTGLLDSGSIVLLTGGSLSGEFVLDLPSGSTYQFSDRYDVGAGSLFLDIVRNPLAPNRQATEDYLTAVENAGPDPALQAFLVELNSLPSDDYVTTLDELHPEPYDAQTSVQLALAREFQRAMLERPDHCIAPAGSGFRHPRTRVPCRPRPQDIWATGYGLIGRREGQVGHTSWDEHGGGLVLGFDQRIGRALLFSGTLGGAHANQTVEGIGQGWFSALDVGALAAWKRGPLQVQGFATYGHGWHEANRQIAFAAVTRTATGQYQSNRYGVGGQLSWTFALSGLDLTPLFEADWARVSRDTFTETGAAPANLIVNGAADSVTNLLVGVELGTSWLKKGYWTDFLEKTDGVWEPKLAVGWRQVVQGADRALVSSYQGAPSASGRFQVDGQDANQGFEIGVGLYFTPKGLNRITLGASYDAFVWKDVLLQDISGTVRLSF
jgi:hypothetical protein